MLGSGWIWTRDLGFDSHMTSRTRLWVLLISTPVIAFAIIGGYLGQAMTKDDTYQHLRVFEDVVSLVLEQLRREKST